MPESPVLVSTHFDGVHGTNVSQNVADLLLISMVIFSPTRGGHESVRWHVGTHIGRSRALVGHESMPQFCNRESSSQAHMRMCDIFMQTAARARMARDIETYKERDRVSEQKRQRERKSHHVFDVRHGERYGSYRTWSTYVTVLYRVVCAWVWIVDATCRYFIFLIYACAS